VYEYERGAVVRTHPSPGVSVVTARWRRVGLGLGAGGGGAVGLRRAKSDAAGGGI
jgi:hypothetical protein